MIKKYKKYLYFSTFLFIGLNTSQDSFADSYVCFCQLNYELYNNTNPTTTYVFDDSLACCANVSNCNVIGDWPSGTTIQEGIKDMVSLGNGGIFIPISQASFQSSFSNNSHKKKIILKRPQTSPLASHTIEKRK